MDPAFANYYLSTLMELWERIFLGFLGLHVLFYFMAFFAIRITISLFRLPHRVTVN